MRVMLVSMAGGLVLIAALLGAAAGQKTPAGDTSRNDGRELFLTYCATCHGPSGRGDGPAAEALTVRPTDLTQLARIEGGAFIEQRIQRTVDGREHVVKAHGSVEMPIWGDAFKRREGLTEEAVRARIAAIVKFLQSIQERAS